MIVVSIVIIVIAVVAVGYHFLSVFFQTIS